MRSTQRSPIGLSIAITSALAAASCTRSPEDVARGLVQSLTADDKARTLDLLDPQVVLHVDGQTHSGRAQVVTILETFDLATPESSPAAFAVVDSTVTWTQKTVTPDSRELGVGAIEATARANVSDGRITELEWSTTPEFARRMAAATETRTKAMVEAALAALNAGDAKAADELFAPEASVQWLQAPMIRRDALGPWLAQLATEGTRVERTGLPTVEGSRAVVPVRLVRAPWLALGPLSGTATVVTSGGRIAQLSVMLTVEARAKVLDAERAAATAQVQASPEEG